MEKYKTLLTILSWFPLAGLPIEDYPTMKENRSKQYIVIYISYQIFWTIVFLSLAPLHYYKLI